MGLFSTGASKAARAAKKAAQLQYDAAMAGIAEQRRQFDETKLALSPYSNAGAGALTGQQDILGLNGTTAQQNAISGFETSPFFQSMTQRGEDAILQNASATGGLRGGNVQAALAQFRPELLNNLINQQYERLGGITQTGLGAATGVGQLGANNANAIANLLGQGASAQAGGTIAAGNSGTNKFNSLLQVGGLAASLFKLSDARLKQDVVKVGETADGFGLYSYTKFGKPEIGVMAQEVEKVKPEAVTTHESGYKMVNYGMVN